MKLPSCEDYEISIETPPLVKAYELQGGYVEKENDIVIRYVGGFCIVFPYYIKGKKHAVRCWIANVADAKERSRIIAKTLDTVQLPYFVEFKYIDNAIATNEGVQPIVLMSWVQADTLKDYIEKHIYDSSKLIELGAEFKNMVQCLHQHNLSHGDLQHGNIMVHDDGSIVLVDYDSMYVPELRGYSDDIKGLAGYQHPARLSQKELSPKSDFFSEYIIYCSLIALAYYPNLWNELQIKDTETLLFSADDIQSPQTSTIFSFLSQDKKSSGILPLLSKIILQSLSKNSIEELSPLENVLVSPQDKIRKKWNQKPEVVMEIKELPSTLATREKWNIEHVVEGGPEIDTEKIKKKWQ